MADYAQCSVRTIARALPIYKEAGLITTKSRYKSISNTIYRFTKLIPEFTTITINHKSLLKKRLPTQTNPIILIQANSSLAPPILTDPYISTKYCPTMLTSSFMATSKHRDWYTVNVEANARALYNYQHHKHKIITSLPIADTIKRLKILGVDTAGAIIILASYPDASYCIKFNEIYQALVIKLTVDGKRILKHGAFSYQVLIDHKGLGLNLVAEVAYNKNYKMVHYQKAVCRLKKYRDTQPRDHNFEKLITYGKKNKLLQLTLQQSIGSI